MIVTMKRLCLISFGRALDHRSKGGRGDPFNGPVLYRARNHAFPAFYAQALVHRFLAISRGENGFHGTASHAGVATAGAFLKVNILGGQSAAHSRRTALLFDVRLILVPEIAQ